MNKDWVVWLGCALLIGCGAVIALLAVDSGGGPWLVSWVAAEGITAKSFFELLSYIATIALAVTAIATMSTWRRQILYAKRHDAFVKLNVALQDLDVFRVWAAAFSDSHVRRYTKETDDEVDTSTASFVWDQEVQMVKAWREYRLAVYEAALHMDPRDLEPCLNVSHVKKKLLTPVQDLTRKLQNEYHGRALSQADWHQMTAMIQITCNFVQSDCHRIIKAGENYIFRQLRPGMS